MREIIPKMNLQLFAGGGTAESGNTTVSTDGGSANATTESWTEKAIGNTESSASTTGATESVVSETVTMTQEQLDALINEAVARGTRKGKKESKQAAEPTVDKPTEPDPAAAAMGKAHTLLINAALKSAAIEMGFIDPEDALAADHADIDVDDDGNVDGAKEAVKALLTKKPHYAKRKESGPAGGGVNGARGTSGKEPLGARIAKRRQEGIQRASKALEPYQR